MRLRRHFLLDPELVFLNHGSFGACPEPVFREYQRWQREVERDPVEVLWRRLDDHLDDAASQLAAMLGGDPDGLLFLPNATSGVNVVARSLRLEPDAEVLASDHEYGACDLTWQFVCERAGARYVRQPVPVPVSSSEEIVDAIWSAVNERTRVLFFSHVSSRTAVTFPAAELCRRTREARILTVVDGAHAPGQLDVDLERIGADFYAGNCHKWLCAPKGAGFLSVRPEHRERLDPLVVSWGWTPTASFVARHRWQGTRDPSAYLSVPAAIEFQRHHDWPAVRRACHELLRGFVDRLGAAPVAAPALYHQMASVELPPCDPEDVELRLRRDHGIEVLVKAWNDRPLLRVSVQAYNNAEDLRKLELALPRVLEEVSAPKN